MKEPRKRGLFYTQIAKKILFVFYLNMKISSVKSFNYHNTAANYKPTFCSTATMGSPKGGYEKDEFESQSPKPSGKDEIPDWLRKTILGTLVFFTFKNDPAVQDLFPPAELSQEEKDRIEYFEDIQNMRKEKGKSTAFFHLNRLNDIEQPRIKMLAENTFALGFELDDKKVLMVAKLDEQNKDTISGFIKYNSDVPAVKYTAVFPQDDIDEFEMTLEGKDGKKITLGRDYYGELYQVQGDEKVILNNKNVERYQEYKELLEFEEDISFFSNSNSMWRKLNYILMIYLLIQEARLEKAKRKKEQDEVE